MFGSTIIDVAIGLIFVFFLLSMISSKLNDLIAGWMQWRAKDLENGVRHLLSDPSLADKVWNHPLIQGLAGKEGKDPAHIPSNTFALALFDAIVPAGNDPTALQKVRATTMTMPESSARQAIVAIIDSANGDIEKARAKTEEWFNAAMDRVSVVYRQRIQQLTLLVALVVTLIFGADSIALAKALWQEPGLRAAVAGAAQANTISNAQPVGTVQPASTNFQEAVKTLSDNTIPIGWNDSPRDLVGWIQKIIGLLLTTLAVSLGAPFWYDLLKNISSARPSGAAK